MNLLLNTVLFVVVTLVLRFHNRYIDTYTLFEKLRAESGPIQLRVLCEHYLQHTPMSASNTG